MFIKVTRRNNYGTIGILIPMKQAEELGIKEGDKLWIDFPNILRETREITETNTFHNSHNRITADDGENNDRQKHTKSNIPSRSNQSNSMEQPKQRPEDATNGKRQDQSQLQGQGRQVARNHELQRSRPTESSTSTQPSIRERSTEGNERVKPRSNY